MSQVLLIKVVCMVCGVLDVGRSNEPATTPRPPNWKGGGAPTAKWDRWAELDRLAEKHEHSTVVSADPVSGVSRPTSP